MTYLTLHPGPRLDFCWYPDPKPRDVTAQAHRFLFEPVALKEGVTVADLLRLLELAPVLQEVYASRFVKELLAEAALGPHTAKTSEPQDLLEGLVVRRELGLDTHAQELRGLADFDCYGVGPVLPEGNAFENVPPGGAVQYAVSLAPLRSLLHLPVKFSPRIIIKEDDTASLNFRQQTDHQWASPEITLGQLLNAVLSTLTFHGAPADTTAMCSELEERASADDTQFIAVEDSILGWGAAEACEAVFVYQGEHTPHELHDKIRDVPDAQIAAVWFAAVLPDVKIASAYDKLSGRELRRAFQRLKSAALLERLKQQKRSDTV